jgi:steroid 5-alpha reductase family enzyme
MEFILSTAFVIWIYMTIVFLFALLKRDNSIVDVFWGMGFILISFYTLVRTGNLNPETWIMNLLVLIWGIRLSLHIYLRNRGRGEDFRYKAWRETWKYFELRSYLQIFMLQGIFMLVISAPIIFTNMNSAGKIRFSDVLGLLFFVAGFLFEAFGDAQLNRFKKDPANKGKIITSGLWSITRHPNYFGEALLWWGIGFFALSYPLGWITLISPLLITLLLRFVSGVPMLEKKYRDHPDWKAYADKTAPFVPFLKKF